MLKKITQLTDVSGVSFKEKSSEIEVLHAGKWEHPQYGAVRISEEDIDKFVSSFNNKVRKVDIAVDQEHMPEKGAAGWFKKLEKVFEDGKAKLKATVEWTALGKQLITDGVFKYFSPEFEYDYEDMETHEHFDDVLLGGALTNRPYFKSLAAVSLSENVFAGFETLKGGEQAIMTKEELKAKLAEDKDFKLADDAAGEEVAALEEAKTELAKEAEDTAAAEKAEADKKAEEEKAAAEALKASEKFISKDEHSKQLNDLKSRLGVAESKLRFKEVTEEVSSYLFSESNPKGVLLKKNQPKAVEILMHATPEVAKLFTEFLKELAPVSDKLFKEQGSGEGGENGEDKNKIFNEEVAKVQKEKGLSYSESVKLVAVQKPELVK